MKITAITFFFVVFANIAFGQHNHQDHNTPTTETQAKDLGKVDNSVRKQLNKVLNHYFDVKNALVATNSKNAALKASNFLKILAEVETAKMTTDQQNYFSKLAEQLKTNANQIAQTTDVEAQRTEFENFSAAMYLLAKSFRNNNISVYKQFCPMAFNDKGAYWLSEKPDVLNPYFGNKMLRCGSVTETF